MLPLLVLSLRDYYPEAPSKFLSVAARWRAHQQYLKTCWSSSAGRKAVIVGRFCGFRLGSLLFPPSILKLPREVSLMTIISLAGFFCGQLERFKRTAEKNLIFVCKGFSKHVSVFYYPCLAEHAYLKTIIRLTIHCSGGLLLVNPSDQI